MWFWNETTDEYAILNTAEEFLAWSAEMDIYDISVLDDAGAWWFYKDVEREMPFWLDIINIMC